MALANESHQNSAALKNITIDTGTTLFNTAIEYDTDVNDTAYSRVKHYINNGKAYSYTYDKAGNISRIQSPDGSWVSYTYDALGQLTGETYSNGDTIAYVYDVRGNILSKTSNGSVIEYGYTDTKWKDHLTSYNGVTITYDTIGNPTAWHDGSAMTWRRGRQLATYAKNGVTTIYSYNDDGIRTSKKVGTNATVNYSVVDGTLRRMSDGTNTLQFVYGNGLSSVIFNGTEYWYVFNAQGDVIGLIDATGAYVVEYTYDSWGKPLSKTGTLADTLGTINPFRYRGYIYDEETGFYYVSSRYYDPEIGRWLNSDNQVSRNVNGMNLFSYCGNNPINRFDPTGHAFETIWDIVSIGFGIVDVCANPTDPWAWVGLGADLLDLVPFVTCLGEGVRAARITAAVVDTTTDIVRTADNVTDTARVIDNSTDSLTTIYRSVSNVEADDIILSGQFNLPDGGMEAKQFAFNYDETVSFGQKMGQNITVSAQLPTSMVPKFYDGGIGGIDTTWFRSGTLTVYGEQLAEFNDAVKGTIKFMP